MKIGYVWCAEVANNSRGIYERPQQLDSVRNKRE